MNRTIILTAVAALTLCGCSSSRVSSSPAATPKAENHAVEAHDDSFDGCVARLKLGMTKQQIIAIMGDDYHQAGRSLSTQGTFEGMIYTPGFGRRYTTALKRSYTLGIAGRNDTNGVTLQLRDGHLANISQF